MAVGYGDRRYYGSVKRESEFVGYYIEREGKRAS